MRTISFADGEYYHLLNRGINKNDIFQDKNDYNRFLFSILHFQSSRTIANVAECVKSYNRKGKFAVEPDIVKEVLSVRIVELVAFTLMPNHFHLLVKQTKPHGISAYMQKLLNSYTKYFNTKYDRNGHILQGPFKAIYVEDNNQLLYLSAYIHKNQQELREWKNREIEYPWSSYCDYKNNRWGNFLKTDIILGQFNNFGDYRKYIESSPAKKDDEKIFE